MEIGANRLAAFVARSWGEPRGLILKVRPLRGGLESAGVAEVTARFSDARGRPRSFGFVVKLLEGKPAREADVYLHLVSPLGGGIAPALLGVEHEGPARCLLFLERVRPVRRWLAGASNVLSGALLVHLRTAVDAPPGSRQRTAAIHAAEDASRVIRRADACWREARAPRAHR